MMMQIEAEDVIAAGYERVDRAVTQMIKTDHAELVAVMLRLLDVVKHRPKLPSAFACLAIAELCLLEADEPYAEREWLRLRNLAVNLAERVAAGPS